MCLLLYVLLGCFRAEDPELASYRAAIAAYDEGVAALGEENLPEALVAFERAQGIRPGDMLLGAWRAKVLADVGDLDSAIEQLTVVLESRPGFAEARYNRSAYAARLSRFEQAASDAKMLLSEDVYSAHEDPDFTEALAHSAFDFVPKARVHAELSVPEHSVVSGTEISVRLSLKSTARLTGLVVYGALHGPLRLTRVLEEPGEGGVNLSWSFRVTGAGEVRVGPFKLGVPGVDLLAVPAKSFDTWSPPNKAVEQPRSESLGLPSVLVVNRVAPEAWRTDDILHVLTVEGQKLEVKPSAKADPIVYERRRNGVADWVLYEYRLEDSEPVAIRVTSRGRTVFEGQL